jgi:hypothetical protein
MLDFSRPNYVVIHAVGGDMYMVTLQNSPRQATIIKR